MKAFKTKEERNAYQRMMYRKHRDKRLRYAKKYRQEHAELLREKDKIYKAKNRDELIEYSRKKYREDRQQNIARSRQYQKNNWQKVLDYQKRRAKQDIRYKLRKNIRQMLWRYLQGQKGGKPVEKLLGYTVEDLKLHLEKQFIGQMSWNNYGCLWHIDHRIPLSKFERDVDITESWSLENLQPKLADENRSKSNKYSEPTLNQMKKLWEVEA